MLLKFSGKMSNPSILAPIPSNILDKVTTSKELKPILQNLRYFQNCALVLILVKLLKFDSSLAPCEFYGLYYNKNCADKPMLFVCFT